MLERFGYGVLILLGLLIFAYVVQAVRLFSADQIPKRNYVEEWNALVLAIPEDERAWPLYRAIADDLPQWPTYRLSDLHPGSETWPELAAFAVENSTLIDRLHEAAARPHLGAVIGDEPPPPTDATQTSAAATTEDPNENPVLFAVPLPQLTILRDAGRLLSIDTYLAAEAGDATRVCDDLTTALRIAEHAYELRFLISDLVSLGLVHRTYSVLSDVLVQYPDLLDDRQLVDLSHRIANANGSGNLQARFESERACIHDLLQRLYSDAGNGDGLPRPDMLVMLSRMSDGNSVLGGSASPWLMPALAPFFASRAAVTEKCDQILALYEAEAQTPLWQRGPSQAEALTAGLSNQGLQRWRYLPVACFMPSLTRASLMAEYITQERDAVLVAVALRIYHRRHGEWPATLDELVPHLLPRVPYDRYDGGPIKYRIVDGQPLLYSVGVDRDDDGGHIPDKVTLAPGDRRFPNRAARNWRPPAKPAYPSPDTQSPPIPDGDWILWRPPSRTDDR